MKKFIISFVLLLVASFAFPQEFYPGMIRIIVNEHSTIPKDGVRSSNENFDLLLSQFEITDISQPLYFAITPELQKLYELHTSHDEDSLFDALKSLDAQEHLFISIEKCPMFYPL